MISIDTKEEVVGYRLIVGYIGVLMMLIGGIVLLPLFTLFFYPQDIKEIQFFLAPGIGAILLGYLLFFNIKGKKKGKLQRNQDAIIVVLCWMLAIFITALPFYLSGSYNLTQAIFETTSGWSTTGLSVVDVDHTSHLFLMHRSLILFFGGVGLVLVMLSVLSDSYGMRLYSAEGHSDRLLPNLVKSARIILTIYFSYTVGGIILYML
ncbi:MAG: potassium transporter TrkG, partial [Longicatena sp.]